MKGWWEDYACGCVSDTVPRKRDLIGYCPVHGSSRRSVWPETPFGAEPPDCNGFHGPDCAAEVKRRGGCFDCHTSTVGVCSKHMGHPGAVEPEMLERARKFCEEWRLANDVEPALARQIQAAVIAALEEVARACWCPEVRDAISKLKEAK